MHSFEFKHDRSKHDHHGVGEFLLHWIRGREGTVSADTTVSIDVTTRNRFEEFRRDVRVVSVVVLFELFRSRRSVWVSFREQHVERYATNETDVDDGNGYREGVQIGEGKFGNDRTREHDSGGGREKGDGNFERIERRKFVYESQESGIVE